MKAIAFMLALLLALCALVNAQNVVELNNSNFDKLVKQGDWLIEFYAPWCEHCNDFAPHYERAARELYSKGIKVKLGKINVDSENVLSARFFVTSLPTLFHIKDAKVRPVSISASSDAVVEHIVKQEWRQTKPRSNTGSPFGLFGKVMTVLGTMTKWIMSTGDFLALYLPHWAVMVIMIFGCLGLLCLLPVTVAWISPSNNNKRAAGDRTKPKAKTATAVEAAQKKKDADADADAATTADDESDIKKPTTTATKNDSPSIRRRRAD
ncbi:hypothetical protein RI367_000416 [Sorochytrium milnesiophthora]